MAGDTIIDTKGIAEFVDHTGVYLILGVLILFIILMWIGQIIDGNKTNK